MSDIRRSILWVVFGFALVLLWDKWQIHNGRQATFFPTGAPVAAVPAATPAAPVDSAVPPAAVPSSAAAAAAAMAQAPSIPRTTHQISTDVLKLVFDSEGGSLVAADLLAHAAVTGQPKHETLTPLTLLTQSDKRTYVAQTGLVGADLPTHKTPMRLVSQGTALADGQDSLVVRFESVPVNGVVLTKTYTLHRGSYVLDVKHEVINRGAQAVSPQLYLQLVRDGDQTAGNTPFYSTFTGPAVYSEAAKFQKVTFESLDKDKAEYQKTAKDGYVAMVQHYFASAWLPAAGSERENFVRKVGALYSVGSLLPVGSVAPGQTQAVEARLFLGPQEEKKLESLTPGLELVKDYGWLTILAKPLYWLLEKIHAFVGNWGWGSCSRSPSTG